MVVTGLKTVESGEFSWLWFVWLSKDSGFIFSPQYRSVLAQLITDVVSQCVSQSATCSAELGRPEYVLSH